jgi:hypothetical protein
MGDRLGNALASQSAASTQEWAGSRPPWTAITDENEREGEKNYREEDGGCQIGKDASE